MCRDLLGIRSIHKPVEGAEDHRREGMRGNNRGRGLTSQQPQLPDRDLGNQAELELLLDGGDAHKRGAEVVSDRALDCLDRIKLLSDARRAAEER